MSVELFVPGAPVPQGNKTVWRTPQGRVNVVEGRDHAAQRRHEAWREAVYFAALQATRSMPIMDGPVMVTLEFRFRRPKSSKREHPTVKPDLDKLIRSVLDSLTGSVFADDSQVVCIVATKAYEEEAGCSIRVSAVPESTESAPEEQPIGTTGSSEAAAGATTR